MISNPPLIRSARRLRPTTVAAITLIASFVLLVSTIGLNPVNRTQEARVLETAREMLGSGWHGWIVPHVNGIVRIQKPPLTYWLAAGSFKIFGVSTWAGRLPM